MSLIRSTDLQLMKVLQRAGAAAGDTADESAQSSNTPAEESADTGDASAEESADAGDVSAEESADGGDASAEEPFFRRTWVIVTFAVIGTVVLVIGGMHVVTWVVDRQDRGRRLEDAVQDEATLFQPLNDPNIPQSDEGPDNYMEGPRQSS